MEEFRCHSTNLPQRLYRVQYPGCMTTFSFYGFTAADTSRKFQPSELEDFKKSVVDQFTWANRNPTPFIATFSCPDHAKCWARKWSQQNEDEKCEIYSISARDMPHTTVFKLSTLVERLRIDIPDGAKQHIPGAYLCLHQIPITAVLPSPQTVSSAPQTVSSAYYGTPYHPLDDYSGSDYEAAENNFNDDLIKMMEGDWD